MPRNFVDFYAEDALLRMARSYVTGDLPASSTEEEVALGSASTLACAAALEAVVNRLAARHSPFSAWDRLGLCQKIDMLCEVVADRADWGATPFQTINRLVLVRNWLAHYKDPYVGLSDGVGGWIKDGAHRPPKVDPELEFSREVVRRGYDAVRQAGAKLAALHGEHAMAERLRSEDYLALA